MNSDSKKFLYQLLNTPSPTGFEEGIQRIVKKRMEKYADRIETDLHGNLIVALNPKAERRVMLAGHCDQIGFMVKHISEDGFIYLDALGGIDPTSLPAAHITIAGTKGPVEGVIGHRPIHIQKPEQRGKLDVTMNSVWVDIGVKDKKEALKLVSIGDSAVCRLGVTELQNDLICGAALDNRVGLFVVMEALRLCASSKISVGLYSVSTVQEEVGLRGATTAAFSVDPEIGIAVDVCHATDNPGNSETKQPPCKVGAGPVIFKGPNTNPVVVKRLLEAAKQAKVPHQVAPAAGLFGNDARAIQVSRKGVATASIGLPNRYMHSQVEVCALKDLELSAKLLAEFIKAIKPSTDFRPK